MWVKKRHKIIFAILRLPFKIFLKLKYNYFAVKYKLEKKPYLILSNHLTTLDPFMLACSFKRPIYFMTSTDLFSNKYGRLIEYLVAPIPKSKSVKDIGAIKGCLRVVKEKGTICVFPEGNRSYDGTQCHIDPSISKLVKMMKIDVVLYNIHGGYGIDPRWCKKGRKGFAYGKVKRVLKYEEIEKMDNDELYKLILNELKVSEYPTPYTFKTRNMALGLERVLYVCPNCGSVQTIYTEGNFVKCSHCDLEVKYNKNLTLTSKNPNFKFQFMNEWYKYQIEYVKNYDFNHQKVIYKDENIQLLKMHYRAKGEPLGKGTLEIDQNCFRIRTNTEVFEFPLKSIFSSTVLGKHKLNFYIDKETYQIKGKDDFNALKYMQMYYHIQNKLKGEEDNFFGM